MIVPGQALVYWQLTLVGPPERKAGVSWRLGLIGLSEGSQGSQTSQLVGEPVLWKASDSSRTVLSLLVA